MKMLPAAIAVALCVRSLAGAAALTPMEPGFRQALACAGGSLAIVVATKRNPLAPQATVVTTTLSIAHAKIVTNALRTMDARGNIYALGYALPGFVKRFRKTLLLPASPPAARSVTSYDNVGGLLVQKRFMGTQPAPGTANGVGYVFSDYLNGRRLNTVTYAPGVGVIRAAFAGLGPDHRDLICSI